MADDLSMPNTRAEQFPIPNYHIPSTTTPRTFIRLPYVLVPFLYLLLPLLRFLLQYLRYPTCVRSRDPGIPFGRENLGSQTPSQYLPELVK